MRDPFPAWLVFALCAATGLLMALRLGGWRPSRSWRNRRSFERVRLDTRKRKQREQSDSMEPVNWEVEPIDWRKFPPPEAAPQGLYSPARVAKSMHALKTAPSSEAAIDARQRVHHAVGDPDHFVLFPAALPASRCLLDVIVDSEASPWARGAAASLLVSLCDDPHPDIHWASGTGDISIGTHAAIVEEVKLRGAALRELARRHQEALDRRPNAFGHADWGHWFALDLRSLLRMTGA